MKFLVENQYIEDSKEIEFFISTNSSLYNYFELDFKGIKPKNVCGFISLNNQDYFIVPKICDNENETNLNIFIYMLLYAYDIKVNNENLSNLQNMKYNFLNLFIKYFSDTLFEELKKGVWKSYISKEENIKILKGKYLIKENFTNFYHQNIYCQYDEFSIDNQLNQFFLYAINIFKKYSNTANLFRCESILDEVQYTYIDIHKLQFKFDRLNHRFKKSFDIAIIILKNIISLVNTNNNNSFSFLFDMSEVFEKFIGNIYKDIDNSTKLQNEKYFGNLKLKPDILTNDLIIDTKYKIVKNREDLKTNDKYQMFTYGINFKKYETVLLYPKHLYDVYENLNLGENSNLVNLKMRSIDLKCEDYGFELYTEEIRRRVANLNEL
ncbi:McrC family protein [Aliarcobacter cibarius]|uniref:McrC family protein n=1 Tax=Aliarcobacter cibarius TaxID=255507 RepID=UPI0010FF3DD5|nr:restriction endonuclease [Aliarcobacter cibarius]TLT03484.1 restriction endonuclease [Aliarcobacter cibarius]